MPKNILKQILIYTIPYKGSNLTTLTTVHPWCGGHSTNINVCEAWEVRAGVQVSKRELHTYIHFDYDRLEILSYKKKKKKIDYS